MSPFRYRGLWQWNPVSCTRARSYDERHMMRDNEWFFDRALMKRYFEQLVAAGINTWILANTHPFPFMIDLPEFPEACVLDNSERNRYRANYHWLFTTARKVGIEPFVLFHTCYVPEGFADKYGIQPGHGFVPPLVAVDYTRLCVRRLCDTYPELAGINAEASENVHPDHRAEFGRDAIVSGIHDSANRPTLFFRGWISDPESMKREIMDRYQGECFFTVKYTWEFLIGSAPDPEFLRWVDNCGAERVLPEFWISNYQPFGCHDTELAAALRERIHAIGCPGFTSHPMDLYGAPFVQGEAMKKLQIVRDANWFATLTGDRSERNRTGKAASRPFQRIAAYMTGNKQNFLQPQILAFVGGANRCAGLQTAARWEELPDEVDNAYGRWMEQIEGKRVRYPTEPGDGYTLLDLIAELENLEEAWSEDNAQEEDDYAQRKDILAQHEMAQAWTQRARAMALRFQDDPEAARPYLWQSLDNIKQIPVILGSDGPYRLLVGRHTVIFRWSELIQALEREIAEWPDESPDDWFEFGISERYDNEGRDFVDKDS